jgi:hypothetical protein
MAGVEVRNLAVEAGASTYAPDWLGSPGQATPDGISARVAAKQAHDPGRLFWLDGRRGRSAGSRPDR